MGLYLDSFAHSKQPNLPETIHLLYNHIYIYRDEYVYTHMNTHIQIYRYVDSYILKA